jgi:uncharacterized protein YcnI
VSPDIAQPGTYAVLTFRMPTESATASSVKLEVDLPTDTPFSNVSYQPVPGWKTTVTRQKLKTPVKTNVATITDAITSVVWTAGTGAAVKPGQFQQFTITAGPVPDTGKIVLPAKQTYSDGTVVNWDEPTPATGEEPEHPAPVLYVTDAPSRADAASAIGTSPSANPLTAHGTTGEAGDATAIAVSLGTGIGGLALGAIALAVALYAATRRRSGRKES